MNNIQVQGKKKKKQIQSDFLGGNRGQTGIRRTILTKIQSEPKKKKETNPEKKKRKKKKKKKRNLNKIECYSKSLNPGIS